MAGDIYIKTLSYDDVSNIERCHGVLDRSVYHADQTNFGVLDQALLAGAQIRVHLPAHCYFTFDRRTPNIDKISLTRLSKILQRTSRPPGIVKVKRGLDHWDRATDVEKAGLLWAEIQGGPIKLEFYMVGLWSVRDHFKDFAMVDE